MFWLVTAVLLAGSAAPSLAARDANEFAATLSESDRTAFEAYIAAQTFHDFKSDAYWREVADKKALRKRKRSSGQAISSKDYIETFPPEYGGPRLSADLSKRWQRFQEKAEETRPPPRPLPGLVEFLAHAEQAYGFRPEVIPEHTFKQRYAAEALRVGLTKDQVVRVYALETSGLGTADMVAGIHPIKKTGKPISTAIGYAQLLAANTTSELVKHGGGFIERLKRMAAGASEPQRAGVLNEKARILGKMLANAKSVPERWDDHVAYARTPKGLGMHALNLDGDIGPWLQVIKLDGLREMAAKRGLSRLNGSQIELMNLAGPGTGLEMMTPAANDAATTNFFARAAYWRNTIVRGKTSTELLAALDKRMDDNITNAGAIEFAAVFDEIAAERQAAR